MKNLKICALSGITLLNVLFFGCRHDPELMPGIDTVCFDIEVQPIISTSCAISDCHTGNGELFPLDSFADIRDHVTPFKPMESQLHKVMIGNPNSESFMPPKSSGIVLTKKQLDLFSLWILQGAIKTKCDTLPCDTITVTFSKTIMPIINSYCIGCHNAMNASGGIELIDFATIKATVDGGRFVGSVEWLPGYKPMPQKSGKLSECKINQLQIWITDTMPNN